MVTTGAAVKLKIAPAMSPINNDIKLYEILVVDNADLPVIDAAIPVSIKVEGAGKLIGIDSGNLVYEGLFKTDTRDSYQSRILVTIQRTAKEGNIQITATAPGLSKATTVINK